MFKNKTPQTPAASSSANAQGRVYSSFANTKGGKLSQAPRPLWNDTTCPIPPSRYYPIGPSPTSYTPTHPDRYKGVPIARSKRVGIAISGGATPGPGSYSSSDLNSPFTSYGDAPLCESVPPKKTGWSISNCPSPRSYPIDVSGPPVLNYKSIDSRDSKSPTKGKRTSPVALFSPHPQFYQPKFKSVAEDFRLGSLILKSPRFPLRSIPQSPGPGDYINDKPKSNAYRQVRLYRRNRKLEHLVADHRNLLNESKLPGPGSYDPLLTHNGKDSRQFEHPATRSYYVLCSTASSNTSLQPPLDDEEFSNLHHYGVTVTS